MAYNAGFDFIGWWNNWKVNEPLTAEMVERKSEAIVRPITLIRKEK